MAKWRPRASSLGYYVACDARALWDRQAWDPDDEDDRESKPAADLGTVEHFLLQDGMRCQFPGPPEEHAPTAEQIASAASLFNDDEATMMTVARKSVVKAAQYLPELPEGQSWLAECEILAPFSTGHIDFLSPDYEIFCDLKTTSRPPERRMIKREHLVQMFAYYLLVKWKHKRAPKRGWVIYVDSRGGSWALPISINFETDASQEYAAWLLDYCRHLRSKALERSAFPRLSTKCKDYFCPYYPDCHGTIVPAGGRMSEQPELPGFQSSGIASLRSL